MTTDSLTASPTPLGPPAARIPVAGHDRGDQAEDERLDHAPATGRAVGERGEARQIGAWCPVLQHDVEDVAAGDTHHADQAVEEDRDEHAGEHPGTTRRWIGSMPSTIIASSRGSSGRRVGRDRRTAGAGDEEDVAIGPASRTTASTAASP